jgi:hypothetical protein
MYSQKWSWKQPIDFPAALAEELALEFETGVLEARLSAVSWSGSRHLAGKATSDEVHLLACLADLYARQGKLEANLKVDRLLVGLRPRDYRFHYNLACTHSRLGQIDAALDALRTALELGYDNFDHLRRDSDLENLRTDRRFLKLLEQIDEQLESK